MNQQGACSDIEENVDYLYNNLKDTIQVLTPEDCRTVCQRIADCVGWSASNGGEKYSCWLKNEMNSDTRSQMKNWISGRKYCGGS